MDSSPSQKFSADLAFVFLLATPVLLSLAFYFGNQESSTAPAPQLEILVRASATSLEVTNVQTSDWHELVVYINGQPPSGFKAKTKAPAPGETVSIPLLQCVDEDGLRFSPLQRAVMYVWVGGGSYNYSRYDVSR